MGRRKLYGKEMASHGSQVVYFLSNKEKKNALKPETIKKHKPDILWVLNPFYVRSNPHAIDYARHKSIPIVMYGTFNPQVPYVKWLDVWKKIDFLFVHHYGFYEYLKSLGLKAWYMPLGFYPYLYPKTEGKKIYDVSFCGEIRATINPKKDKR